MEYALVLLWLVAFQALAFAALPVAARLFVRFPDRGASFAVPVGLAVTTTVVFLIGHVGFGRWTAFLGVAALAALSLVVLRREPDSRLIRPRGYAEAALVFTVAFLLLVAIRAVDPAIVPGGGEKFLDYGIYRSLLRGDALPPEDVWWAGDHVLYYYGGHLMAAILTHLTGTAPEYGYNLALSGFYASLVTAAYGLAAAMGDARGASRTTAGFLGAFFVGFASNLVVPVTGLIWLLPDSLASGIADRLANAIDGSSASDLVAAGLSEFGYWAPSRVIPGTINEFPLFAFLNGDLHGHMLSTQFLLLIAALGFAYYRTDPGNRRRRRVLALGALPPVVALLTLVNVWSFLTGLGVAWLALVFGPADPLTLLPGVATRTRSAPVSDGGAAAPGAAVAAEARRVGAAFVGVVAVGALAVVWLSPFVAGILLQSASNRSLGALPTPTTATGLLLVHGAFLLAFALYLWPRARESL
jgi:YYY domain-containing protein